jgi:hypothetical protein
MIGVASPGTTTQSEVGLHHDATGEAARLKGKAGSAGQRTAAGAASR